MVDWLMEGDPVIRWQVMRDLLDAPTNKWEAERRRVATEGWGAAILARQLPDASWRVGRWTGTTWTLLLVVDCGLPASPMMAGAVEDSVRRLLPKGQTSDRTDLLEQMDLCHLGFWLRSYFLPGDPRWLGLADVLLSVQLADGVGTAAFARSRKRIMGRFTRRLTC